jgi:hypothetical protein
MNINKNVTVRKSSGQAKLAIALQKLITQKLYTKVNRLGVSSQWWMLGYR